MKQCTCQKKKKKRKLVDVLFATFNNYNLSHLDACSAFLHGYLIRMRYYVDMLEQADENLFEK